MITDAQVEAAVLAHDSTQCGHSCNGGDCICMRAALEAAQLAAWQPIETAPKDGTKIDLLYPYPRGRKANCFWIGHGWAWREPVWRDGQLEKEDRWPVTFIPNLKPIYWMPIPATPALPSWFPIESAL